MAGGVGVEAGAWSGMWDGGWLDADDAPDGSFEITPLEADPSAGGDVLAPTLPTFAINFTVEADCASLLPYGEQRFPADTVQGKLRNFRSLPFPLVLSSCQLISAGGAQTTRARRRGP